MLCYFGNRGISFLLSSIVFHVIPTALEIGMVCGILVSCSSTPIESTTVCTDRYMTPDL
jgi:ATP-binding cassette, subfamily B (MDR/TAP), member 7